MTPTPEQITAAARALADHNADVCNVNREDNWMIYGDSFRESAEIALRAAAGTTADAAAIAEREAFEWPPLPAFPEVIETLHGDPVFTEHQMQGYANAYGEAVRAALATTASTDAIAPTEGAKLAVWYGPMPESNGKTNWTAILHKGDVTEGITIDRSEYPDRVRYEADRMRWMIGELADEPWILDYDADKHSGYTAP